MNENLVNENEMPDVEPQAPGQSAPPSPEQAEEASAALAQRAAEAELRAAAAVAGVSAEKLPYVVRLCDAPALTAAGADMGALATAQVAALLKEMPELCARPAGGSLGDHKRAVSWAQPEETARATFAAYL